MGIYRTWEAAKQQVDGYSGASYKSFATEGDAAAFIEGEKSAMDAVDPSRTIIYTDGSSEKGVGGYGVYVETGEDYLGRVPISPCSNQKAELYAIYVAMQVVKGPLLIRTDSRYAIGCLTEWVLGWERNGWDGIVNKAIIQKCMGVLKTRDVVFEYVKAHSGIPGNERADELAETGRINGPMGAWVV